MITYHTIASYALKRENRFTLSANHVSYHCNGTENNITNCDHSEYLFYDCVGGTSAGAICASMIQLLKCWQIFSSFLS